MCGIAGIIEKSGRSDSLSQDLATLEKALGHRGPDGSGVHQITGAGFLNVRLAIVDRAHGKQPIFSNDNRIGIVYNGEVYNHQALRSELEKEGESFRTNSDTEVVLKMYERYGTDSFRRLNGMFAFCIWDENKNLIYLVRDGFGIKPLYIYEDSRRIVFSSELKALLSLPDLDLPLDEQGLQDYLTFRYMQAPYTSFKNIRRLEAGTFLKIQKGSAAQFRYWDLEYQSPEQFTDPNEVRERLEVLFHDAVKTQLMGEVPIGVLLSGGIDSSAIAYFVRELGANLTTYNIGFPETNEFEFSGEVAKKFELEHREITMTVDELVKSLDEVVLALDEPIADPACLPLYRLSRELTKEVTVVLSGEGGDELFAGYPQYQQTLTTNTSRFDSFETFLERSWYFLDGNNLLANPRIPPRTFRFRKYYDPLTPLNGMLAYDMRTWMPDNLMMKADKMMMAHSLEGRFPFLDKNLFQFAATLPDNFKLRGDVSKWILREMLGPKLPKLILERPKMGFSVPVAELLQKLKPLVMQVAHDNGVKELDELLDFKKLQATVTAYYERQEGTALRVWTNFVLLYWFNYAFPRYRKGATLPGRSRA